MSEEEVNRLVDLICGEIRERESAIPEATAQETLKLLSMIDPQEKESFKELIDESLDKLAAEEKKIEKKMKLDAAMEATGAQRSSVPALGPTEVRPPQAKAPSSGSRVAKAARQQAPPELLRFLPTIPSMYLHWEPRNNRVYCEFKDLKEFQRTKSKKFDKEGSRNSKLAALQTILEYVHQVYHLKFTNLPNYDSDWKPHLGEICYFFPVKHLALLNQTLALLFLYRFRFSL